MYKQYSESSGSSVALDIWRRDQGKTSSMRKTVLVMYGGIFFCLGFSVGCERSVEVDDDSSSHRLKPKDENLGDFFITVFTNWSLCPGRNSYSLVFTLAFWENIFCILSPLSDETFPGATAALGLLGDDKSCTYIVWGTVWVNSLFLLYVVTAVYGCWIIQKIITCENPVQMLGLDYRLFLAVVG